MKAAGVVSAFRRTEPPNTELRTANGILNTNREIENVEA
jgi:hypothetical protein